MDLTHRPPSTITHITQVDDTVTVVGQQAALLSAVAGDLQVGEGLMVVDEGDMLIRYVIRRPITKPVKSN